MRNDVERQFAADPIIAAAIAAYGLKADELPWEQEEMSTDETVRRRDAGKPDIILSRTGRASIRWWRARPDTTVRYDLEENDEHGGIVTIEETATPESLLTAMAGRPLSDVVDLPGAGLMTIETAVNSNAFASDPLDTRIAVRRSARDENAQIPGEMQ